ncbi:MAG: virulence protein RhuM/Fic/DOC family protein [Candidatus Peregrinibacteria bacterium]
MSGNKKIVVYQAKNGAIQLRTDNKNETIWATQAEMAAIFGVNPQAVTKHLKNIYKEKELSKKATCSKMEQVRIEGKREVKRHVEIYNLDAIISVGYRIGSKMGTKFRQWATKTLRSHITEGYTINRKRLAKNYSAFLKAIEQVRNLLPSGNTIKADDAIDLIKMFANTWFSLDAYDKEKLPKNGATEKEFQMTAEELEEVLSNLKQRLIKQGQATQLFGSERKTQSVDGILGSVLQSFGGKDLYPTVEEKAAHLLYFMVKNHPFVDGNKRSGAFAFVWFLRRTGVLNPASMTPEALTALTLLVAESSPKEKERMIGLILLILQ